MSSWDSIAWQELQRLAASGDQFTADDLLNAVGHPDAAHGANGKNNRIGQVFRQAASEGLIVPVGVAKSRQPRRKGGMVRIWTGRR